MNIEVDHVTKEELGLSDHIMMRCKLITGHLSLFHSISKIYKTIVFVFFFCNIHALLGIFKTSHDRVILVPLGAIGFDGLMVANEVLGLGELVVSSGTTLSGNLAVVDIILS